MALQADRSITRPKTLLDWTCATYALRSISPGEPPLTGLSAVESIVNLCWLLEALILHEHTVFAVFPEAIDELSSQYLISDFHKEGHLSIQRFPHEIESDPAFTPMTLWETMNSHYTFTDEPYSDPDDLYFNIGPAEQLEGTFISIAVAQALEAERMSYSVSKGVWPRFPAAASHIEYLLGKEWWMEIHQNQHFPDGRSMIDLARAALGETIASACPPPSTLEKEYRRLRKALHSDIQRLYEHGRPVSIFIPPIAAIILDKAKERKYIAEAALDLRSKLEPLRAAFNNFESVIRDDSLSIADSLRAENELARCMEDIVKPYETRDVTKISRWKDVLDTAKDLFDGISIKDFLHPAKFLLGEPLGYIVKRLRRRRVLYLSTIKDNFRQIKDYGSLASTVTGAAFTRADVTELYNDVRETAKFKRSL